MPYDWEGGFVHEKGRFSWMRLRQGGAGNLHYFTPVLPIARGAGVRTND